MAADLSTLLRAIVEDEMAGRSRAGNRPRDVQPECDTLSMSEKND